jgi:type II secretory pathway component HofQ
MCPAVPTTTSRMGLARTRQAIDGRRERRDVRWDEDAIKRDAIKRGAIKRDAIKRGAIKRDAIKRDAKMRNNRRETQRRFSFSNHLITQSLNRLIA